MNGVLSTTRLTCSHCKKTLKTFHNDELAAFLHRDEGVYIFCNRDCRREWACPITPGKDHGKAKHPSF